MGFDGSEHRSGISLTRGIGVVCAETHRFGELRFLYTFADFVTCFGAIAKHRIDADCNGRPVSVVLTNDPYRSIDYANLVWGFQRD